MKTYTIIKEGAKGKPSDLKKYKKTERKETVHFRDGDIYDFSDPGYDDEFKYYDASGNGYIKDKEGHVYDVIASTTQGDAGRIAGGSTSYYVCIKKANGKDDFVVHGYSAIFSSGSNTECVYDISDGYYLEDYIAKYYNSYTHGDKFKELAGKGDKNAKPYVKIKAERDQQKRDEFDTRYLKLPSKIAWEITDKFRILDWHPGSISGKDKEEYEAKKQERSQHKWNSPEYDQLTNEIKEIEEKADEVLFSIFKPVLINKIQTIFKTKDILTLKGVSGTFEVPKVYVSGKKDWGDKTLAIDTKKKILVVIHTADRKVLDEQLDITIGDIVNIDKSKMNDKTEKLFKTVAQEWKRKNGRTQTEYVEAHWRQIQQAGGSFWGTYNKSITQSKKEAKEDFIRLVRQMDWEQNKKLSFPLSLVQLYIEGDFNPEDEPIEEPLQNPEPKKERGKNTVMSRGAQAAAYDKMKAWHEGRRKQNLTSCSDAKLKMNYKVCKELGYDKEIKAIEDEAAKRQLTLEGRISLKDYMMISKD